MSDTRHRTTDRFFIGMLVLILAVSLVGLAIDLVVLGRSRSSQVTTTETSTRAEPVRLGPEVDNRDGFWRFDDPDNLGLSPKGVDAYLELCRRTGADAVLIARGHTIAGEFYSHRYTGEQYAMSSTKSVTGLLVGIAQDAGYLTVTDRVGEYLPEWNGGPRERVTIEHLLTQSSGLLQRSGDEVPVGAVSEKNEFVRGLEPKVEPGTRFSYSNEGVQLLSPVLESAVGTPVDRFAEERLFRPIGMASSALHYSGADRDVWTYADMRTTPRDFARLGVLVMQGGTWQGERVVSSSYLDAAFSPSPLQENYGYLWWRLVGELPGVATLGYLSTDMYVMTEHDLIVVRMQAPRTQYTGEAEDAPYSQRLAALTLGAVVGEYDADAAWQEVTAIPDRAQ
jgi:CubicO group peptidase (beta-lactamase class C family)